MADEKIDHFKRGNKFYGQGRYIEAIRAYEEAIRLDPKDAVPWNRKGNALRSLGRHEDAIRAYEEAFRLDPKDAAPWNGKGNALNSLGRHEDAIHAYDEAIRLDPKDATPWYEKENIPIRANCAFDWTIWLNPELAHPWNGKGNALYSLGRHEDAIRAYEEAIRLDPKLAYPWNGKGNALGSLDRYEDAIRAYDEAIRLDPKYAAPWFGEGSALYCLNRHEDAIHAYDEAIRLDPKYALSWCWKANVYRTTGHSIGFSVCLLRFCRLAEKTDISRVLKTLAQRLPELHRPLLAHELSRRFPFLMTSLTWVSAAAPDLRQALPWLHFLRHIRQTNASSERHIHEGLVHFFLGNPATAFEHFDETDSEDDQNLMNQYYLVASLNAFAEPAQDETEFALKQGREYAAGKMGKDPLQWYYAGQLFRLDENFQAARDAFAKARELENGFLAAAYMEMFCHHRLKDIGKRNRLALEILHLERLRSETGNPGFLGPILPDQWEFAGDQWDRPLRKYAQWTEISESLGLLHRMLEYKEIQPGDLPPDLCFVDRYTVEDDRNPLQSWIENRSLRRELEAHKEAMDRKELEVLRARLGKAFFEFPFHLEDETALEREIVHRIEELREEILSEGDDVLELILYFYCIQSISFETCLALLGYAAFLHHKAYREKNVHKTEDMTKASFAAIAAALLFSGPGLLLPSLGFVGIYFIFFQLLDFCAKGNVQRRTGYGRFKADLLPFLEKENRNLRELLGI